MNEFIFPFDKVEKGSKIILYGAGAVAKDYLSQLSLLRFCEVLFAVDRDYRVLASIMGVKIKSPQSLATAEFDHVVVAVTDVFLESVLENLNSLGVPADKIVHSSDAGRIVKANTEERERINYLNAYIGGLFDMGERGKEFVEYKKLGFEFGADDVKPIAMYLPQFHTIPENDKWWGKGYTEWRNVTSTIPLFDGHYQPQLPYDMPFYDLGNIEHIKEQVKMAKNYGIYGFMFYYYNFGGKRLLEKPLDIFLDAGKEELDFPFCLSWANESWANKASGSLKVFMPLHYSDENSLALIKDICRYVQDARYIRINGKPLIMIYRPTLLYAEDTGYDPNRLIKIWRNYCRSCGVGEIHIVATLSEGAENPLIYDYDGCMEFPPHGLETSKCLADISPLPLSPDLQNSRVGDMEAIIKQTLYYKNDIKRAYKTVFPNWDNTPRRKRTSVCIFQMPPSLYKKWLRDAVSHTRETREAGDRLIFINAWNEWGEGAHLEPCQKHGYAYLQATYDCLLSSRTSQVGGDGLYNVRDRSAMPNSLASEWPPAMHKDYVLFINDFVAELDMMGIGLTEMPIFNVTFYQGKFFFLDYDMVGAGKTSANAMEHFMTQCVNPLIRKIKHPQRAYESGQSPCHFEDTREFLDDDEKKEYMGMWGDCLKCIEEGQMLRLHGIIKDYVETISDRANVISCWSDYQKNFTTDPEKAMTIKQRNVVRLIRTTKARTMIDLAGNMGWFGVAMAGELDWAVSVDMDAVVSDCAYKYVKDLAIANVIPLNFNLITPASDIHDDSKNGFERFRCDLALALAIVHHLTKHQGLTFDEVIKLMTLYTRQYLIVEFVDRDDACCEKFFNDNPAHLSAYYTKEKFEEALQKHFAIMETAATDSDARILYLCEKKIIKNAGKLRIIEKGSAEPQKYYMETAGKSGVMCFHYPLERRDKVECIFEILKGMATAGGDVPKPIEYGMSEWDGIYLIVEWIDGEDLCSVTGDIAHEGLFRLGVSAARNLRMLHSISLMRDLSEFDHCEYAYMKDNEELIRSVSGDAGRELIAYVEENKHLLRRDPKVIVHCDFALHNMMISNGELVIIDFNAFHQGVKWTDLGNTFKLCRQAPSFAVGMLHGYFDEGIKSEDWDLLMYYGALRCVNEFRFFAQISNTEWTKRGVEIASAWLGDLKNRKDSLPPDWYRETVNMLGQRGIAI